MLGKVLLYREGDQRRFSGEMTLEPNQSYYIRAEGRTGWGERVGQCKGPEVGKR